MSIKDKPKAETGMLIRKPVESVFEAFINPDITTKFWFTKSSGRLEEGKQVTWTWEIYDHSVPVVVKSVISNEQLIIEWGNYEEKTIVEWNFKAIDESKTFVSIANNRFEGTPDDLITKVSEATEGFSLVLVGLKAYLEHNVQLNLVADRFPKDLQNN